MSDNLPSSSSPMICNCCGSRRISNLLDEPNFVSSLKKLLEQLLPLMMATNLRPVLEPMMKDLVKNAVDTGLGPLLQWFNIGRAEWNEAHNSEPPRKLALKFSDAVSSPVYTGEDIKGKEGNFISIALVDAAGKNVNSGVEASSIVEIMVVADVQMQTKPLLLKNIHKLKDGVVVLDSIRFKSGEKWTKQCEVKLAARILTSSPGSTVENAETESFLVFDSRKKCYGKSKIPSLSDSVCKLKKISRTGKLRKRLCEANVETVEQLLVSVNAEYPQSLQQILDVSSTSAKYKVILDHAQKCEIPADRYTYHCTDYEGYRAVVFDVVGRVLGLIRNENPRFVHADDLNEDEKVEARRVVKSAFAQRKDLEPYYDNEASTSGHADAVALPADQSFLEDDSWINDLLHHDIYSLWLNPDCSGLGKGRWKRAVILIKIMAKWLVLRKNMSLKRILARDEDTHAQKRQRCG